ISKEFSVFKDRMGKVLHAKIDRVKTLMRINNFEPKLIKSLDDRQDKLVQDSLAYIENPQREKQRDMGM
ncbi:hypothetical protein, partial [Bacillus cereus]|uniref:hypothetical protein n=1 Tax=Bacillus cereus TaxID=1396 RepID=UPI002112D307